MKSTELWLALALALPAMASAQGKVELNRVTRVQIRGQAVEITATRPPSFTTFNLADPPRLVIDVAEAVFSGVPGAIAGSGGISGVKTVSYGTGSAAIARVVIGFERELETDIETSGNLLVVRVLGAGAPAVATGNLDAGAAKRAEEEQRAAEREASKRAAEERVAQEKAAREAANRAEAERKARAESEKAAREEAARQAEAQRRAEAEAAKLAEDERRALEKAERERIERERAEQKRAEQQRAEREKAEQQRTEREKAEQLRAERESRRQAEVEARQRAEEERRAREEAARKAREERIAQQKAEREAAGAAKREAEAQRKREQQARLEAARNADAQRRAEEKERREAAARAREETQRAAAVARRQREEARRSSEVQRVASADAGGNSRRTLALVGFHPSGQVSRVFIRTDAPAPFEIREADDKTIVVALPNTRIGSSNNARFLDTSFFDTPVQRVSPTEVGRDVHVEIKLKTVVSYQARQDGADLVLEFQPQ